MLSFRLITQLALDMPARPLYTKRPEVLACPTKVSTHFNTYNLLIYIYVCTYILYISLHHFAQDQKQADLMMTQWHLGRSDGRTQIVDPRTQRQTAWQKTTWKKHEKYWEVEVCWKWKICRICASWCRKLIRSQTGMLAQQLIDVRKDSFRTFPGGHHADPPPTHTHTHAYNWNEKMIATVHYPEKTRSEKCR